MRLRSALVAVAFVLASCGGSTQTSSNAVTPTTTAAAPATSSTATTDPTALMTPIITGPDAPVVGSPLPVVAAVDLHTGNIVRLDWLVPGDKPVLVWFWAPH
jgi:hypothetical protein